MDANTPATQSFPPDGNPAQEGTAPGNPPQDNPVRAIPVSQPVAKSANAPSRPKGPNASAVVLGLVSLVLAGLIIASETTTWQVDWSGLGPGAIVVIGAVLVVIGAIGLVRRHDDL